MKRCWISFAVAVLGFQLTTQAWAEEVYRPFVLAQVSQAAMQDQIEDTRAQLERAGFDVVGEYQPYPEAYVIAFTNDRLREIAGATEKGGYGTALRAGVTQADGEVQVSYTHPVYLAHAYRLEDDLGAIAETLADALGASQTFGSEEGMTPPELNRYRYMFGMERFHHDWRLTYYDDHEEAVEAVAENLERRTSGVEQVYRIDIRGRDAVVFGVALTEGGAADEHIMGVIDFDTLKHTPHLPYEMLVVGHEVFALHTRFRIAVNFPDLGMMGDNSFWQIRDAPDDIHEALSDAAGAPD